MAIFYTARKGMHAGEKTLNNALAKAMEKDEIIINQNTLAIDETVSLRGGVTISGDPDRKRPVLIAKERQNALSVGSQVRGTVYLKHLDLQLNDSSIGLRVDAKDVRLVLEDVRIFHHSQCTTPYNALLVDSHGVATVEISNSVIDSLNMDVNQLQLTRSSIGNWFRNSEDYSQAILSQGRVNESGLQNIVFRGHDDTSQMQVQKSAMGGNTRFDSLQVSASDLTLTQLPSINYRGKKMPNVPKDATSLIVGSKSKFMAKRVRNLMPDDQKLMNKAKLTLPQWRSLGIVDGTLLLSDAYLVNTGLKNIGVAGGITFENVSDDSQWDAAKEMSLANRGSQSQLFDQQSKLNITGVAGDDDIKNSQNALQKLDRMIGLDGVKKRVNQIVSQAKMNAERQRRGLNNSDNQLSINMVFAGSPGTGKTVVARLVGQALFEAGVLKAKKFVEARQADLVGEHVGETAPKTKAVLRSALDGVLFIDEAYELAPPKGGGNSFNNEAVTELIADMENYSNRLVVIMAGYTEDMSDFFRRGNKGLASRINNWIEFPDYSATELKKIERLDLEDSNARLRDKNTMMAMDKGIDTLLPVISKANTAGNGRFVRNYVQKITEMRDARLSKQDTSQLTDNQLMIIEPQDVQAAVQAMSKQAQDMQQ